MGNSVDVLESYYDAVRKELGRKFAPSKNARVLELFGNVQRDLLAWEALRAECYVLIDKNDEKVASTADWWYSTVVQKRTSERFVNGEIPPLAIRWTPASSMTTRYITVDCFCTNDNFQSALALGGEGTMPYDIVCAYAPAITLAFESEFKLKALLKNISENLKVGGFAIFTFPCTNRLVRWCRKSARNRASDGTVGNSIVRFWSDCRYEDGLANHYRYAEKNRNTREQQYPTLKHWFLVDETILNGLATDLFGMSIVFSAPFESIVDTNALDSTVQDTVWLWKALVLQKK